jgi:two-component system response regulator (stage 0 sporulation protein A)
MEPLRILIADENEDFARGLSEWVASEPGLLLVGVTRTGVEAAALCRTARADVVLIDVALRPWNGFETTRRIKGLLRAPKVVMHALHTSHTVRVQAAAVGADGFVAKAEIASRLRSLLAEMAEDLEHGGTNVIQSDRRKP